MEALKRFENDLRSYIKDLKSVNSYNSLSEKNALITLLDENTDIDKVFKTLDLKSNITNPNTKEKEVLITLSRRISVSESISFDLKCPKCKKAFPKSIEIDSMFIDIENKNLEDYLEFFEVFEKYNIPLRLYGYLEDIENIVENFDDLTLDEVNEIDESIFNINKLIYNNTQDVECIYCSYNIRIKIDILESISKFPIKNIYEQYLDLMEFGNMSKYDVDNLPPFEREIFLGLIQERIDKEQG
jgi:predicted aldo/keto reductase-like oxidoreductase